MAKLAQDSSSILLAGSSAQARQLKAQITKAGRSDMPVLVFGEAGAGKTLTARLIHSLSGRAGKLVPFYVAGKSEHDLDVFLKKHTPATPGAKAGRNTLYFDDIVDLSPAGQKRLAVYLKAGEQFRDGLLMPKVIGASSQDLLALARYNAFSRDLLWLLGVQTVSVPNLQHRKVDIPVIFKQVVQMEFHKGHQPTFSDEAAKALVRYNWPGNIRELRNLVKRMKGGWEGKRVNRENIGTLLASPIKTETGMGRGQNLSSAIYRNLEKYFKAHPDALPPPGLYDRILREVERPLISLALGATKGNQIKAAHLLGLNRNTLRKKLKNLDIDAKDLKS